MSTPSVAASYRGLFAQPLLRRLAVADVGARLPQGMVTVTLLLVAAQHASMTVAGLAVAGYTVGQAATGPLRGRLADRRGLLPVAVCCVLGYALALAALLASALAAAPAGVLIAAAAAAGLLNPPLSPGLRSLWSSWAGARLKQTAFALDAAVFDLAYITGPVLAGALATGIAPAAAVIVLLALTGAAVLTIVTPARAEHPEPPAHPERSPRLADPPPVRRRSRLGPLRSAALRELLITAALTNAALSATEVALIAYVRHHHALWASGPLLAEVSIGSILGSLLLGARAAAPAADGTDPGSGTDPGTDPDPGSGSGSGARLARLLAGYTAGLALLTAASLYAPLLAVAAPLAGLCLGPTLATLFGGAAAAAPRGSGTETQAWINSIMNGGAAGGAALAGLAAGRPVLALGLAAAAAAAAALSGASTTLRSGTRKTGRRRPRGGPVLSPWTRERVLDAAAEMEYLPSGAIELRTEHYRLVRYPDAVLDPTFHAAQVTWSRTTRPLEEMIDEIAAHVRGWDLPGVAWWVSSASRPPGTEQALRDRGAEMIDAVQVLARELGGGLPDPDAGVVVELVRDERTFRASSAVSVRGWGRAEPDEAETAAKLAESLRNLATWSSFRVVAFDHGEPVSTGGCTLDGEVAQLWGAVTLPASRGRGSYRAVLAERLRLARDHGATLALVKGRVLTSGPILLRAGFADYGEERCFWLPVS